MKKTLVFALFSYFLGSLHIAAQESKFEDLAAVYVYRFIDFTSWPDEQNKTQFDVVYLGNNQELFGALTKLSTLSIREKAITLRQTSDVQKTMPADVIFVDEAYLRKLRTINVMIARNPILVVSVNAKDKQRIGINLVIKGNNLEFEVNRYNVIFQGLTMTHDIVLAGGTEIDVAELLKEMEQELFKSRDQLSIIEADLTNKTQSLLEKERLIIEKQQTFENLEANLRKQLQENELLRQQFSSLSAALQTTKSSLLDYAEQLELQQLNVQDKSQQLDGLGLQISQKQKLVDQQEADISKQRKQLQKLEITLVEKLQELDTQTSTISQLDKTIDKQSFLLLLFFGLLILALVITLVIIRWARQKSQLNHKLSVAVEDLNKTNVRLLATQEQLVDAEKLAALGGIVAGVAHEINTPIGIAVTASSIIADKLSAIQEMFDSGKISRSRTDSLLKDMLESSQLLGSNLYRAKELVYSFKQVSADQISEERRKINLDEYLNEICRNLSYLLKKSKHTVEIICPDNLLTNTYPGALAQVISNLIVNSVEHGFTDMQNGKILIHVASDAEKIVVDYTDDGSGIADNYRKKVFEPFFTTGRAKGNTGLGMHISHNLVYQTLEGTMTCEDSKQGAHFVIILPLNVSVNEHT